MAVPTYSREYLTRLLAAVDAFSTAFEAWMQTQVEISGLFALPIAPNVEVRDDQDPAEVQRLELELAEAAGLAAKAVSITGASFNVQGIGLVDPIANWSLMSYPKPVFTPRDVRMTVATIRGRLTAMLDEEPEGRGSGLPAFAPAQLHEVIWSAAAAHWTAHQYRVAVREAASALTVHWKERLGRNDVDDSAFWGQTLAKDPDVPYPTLVWPDDSADKTAKSMRGGLQHLAVGLNLTVRNITSHTTGELSEQDAMERLAAYSFLARTLDLCEIRPPRLLS